MIEYKNKEEIMKVLEEIKKEAKEVEKEKFEKKQFTILGFTVWRILAYFVVYSFLGFVIETIYGMITKGVIESRQSFLYGPFCGIYGLGAVIMILFLQFFNKNNNHLFFGGFLIGSIVEYLVSLVGELILHVKWWDYSDMPFNIGGRICIFFSIFWGLLAIYLMSYVNPKVDRLIDFFVAKMSMVKLRVVTAFAIVFLIVDCLVTTYALSVFVIRKVYENDLNVARKEVIAIEYQRIYSNPKKVALINRYFHDEKMIKTFPNLKMEDANGNMIYFDCFVGEITPYYYKLNSYLRRDLIENLKQGK